MSPWIRAADNLVVSSMSYEGHLTLDIIGYQTLHLATSHCIFGSQVSLSSHASTERHGASKINGQSY